MNGGDVCVWGVMIGIMGSTAVGMVFSAMQPSAYDHPQLIVVCDEEVTESKMVPAILGNASVGISIGGSVQMVSAQTTKCVRQHEELR